MSVQKISRGKMKTELVIEMHPNGKLFIELDSLIQWCSESESSNKDKQESAFFRFVVYLLEGMRDKALSKPNRIMTEKQYYEAQEK